MRALFFGEALVLDATDDADNRHPLSIASCLNATSDRIACGPVTARKWFIDDRDERCVGFVRWLKITSLQQRNAQRLKRSRRDARNFGLLCLCNGATFRRFLSFDDESIDVPAIAERQVCS